jgi:hypothetical protein
MITTGVIGRRWRASVSECGAVQPWDGSPAVDWYVAAEDRWHVPASEPTVRQRRVDGTAVVETRVRIPNGDAVQRVYSVADAPGFTVIEVENDSSMPIAVAFDRPDLRTERPIGTVPVEGIELPVGSFVLPVGHRATARVAIAHDGSGAGPLPPGLPTALQVARGWLSITERASRVVVPDTSAAELTAVRCELALGGPAHGDEDPVAFLLGLGELARMGERLDPWMPELVGAVERVGPSSGWDADAALDAAARILHRAGEPRALRDLARIRRRRRDSTGDPVDPPSGARFVAWLERRLAVDGMLLPAGLPSAWLGSNVEVYGVPVGAASSISYALRWHGERPAVLWEVTGEPVELTAPAIDPTWRTRDPAGEALWAAPVPVAPPGDVSFS